MIRKPKGRKVYSGWDSIPTGLAEGEIQEGCLVIEGGAFRGIYHEGVLDALLIHGIHIHTVIGVSAGALAAMNYVSGQIGRPARLLLGYRHHPLFVGWKALLTKHALVNVDFPLYDYCAVEALDEERFLNPKRHYLAPVTNCLTGETEYLDTSNCKDMILASKASATMQFTSPIVRIDGVPYLDAGCSTDIPYKWGLDHNVDKIVVIRTMHKEFRKPAKMKKLASFMYHKYPKFAASVNRKNFTYNAECDELERLEKEGRVFVIAPSAPVTAGRLEPDMELLGELYWRGYHDAEASIERLREYLAK